MEDLIKELFKEENSAALHNVSLILTKKELEILKYRCIDLLTFKAIGDIYGDTKQHISQTYKRCVSKISRLDTSNIFEEKNDNKETIEELFLSNRAYNALKNAGLKNIKTLLVKRDEDLLKIKGLGKKVLSEINLCLKKEGLEKKDPTIYDDIENILVKYNKTIPELIEEIKNVEIIQKQ